MKKWRIKGGNIWNEFVGQKGAHTLTWRLFGTFFVHVFDAVSFGFWTIYETRSQAHNVEQCEKKLHVVCTLSALLRYDRWNLLGVAVATDYCYCYCCCLLLKCLLWLRLFCCRVHRYLFATILFSMDFFSVFDFCNIFLLLAALKCALQSLPICVGLCVFVLPSYSLSVCRQPRHKDEQTIMNKRVVCVCVCVCFARQICV